MVPTKSGAINPQYSPKRPKKCGFKISVRCRFSRVIYDFDFYMGKKAEDPNENEFGKDGK